MALDIGGDLKMQLTLAFKIIAAKIV